MPPKNLTVRLDDDTRAKLELIAEREVRPMANQIVVFVRQSIERYITEHGLDFLKTYGPDGEVGSYYELWNRDDLEKSVQ